MNNLIGITTQPLLAEKENKLAPLINCELLVQEPCYFESDTEGGAGGLRQESKIRSLTFAARPESLRAAAHDLLAAADAAEDAAVRWIPLLRTIGSEAL